MPPTDSEPEPLEADRIEPRHDELRGLLDYWQIKRRNRRAPSRADIDPIEIPNLLPFVVLMDIEREPTLRFRHRLIGTAVVSNFGRDLTGRYFDEIVVNDHQRAIGEAFARVATWGPPLCSTWQYTREDGRHVRYERMALPMSSNGTTVDMLFGGCAFDQAYG
jgi:hypothetical protein